MPDDSPHSQGPEEERILPAEWRRRLAERRARDAGSQPGAAAADPAAELARRRLHDDFAKVKADLDEMLAEVAEPEAPEPAPAALSDEQMEDLRREVKKRVRRSEKRLRKSLGERAERAGARGAREAFEASSRSLEQQVQAAEEELREHVHTQLAHAVRQARKRGEADARRDLERTLERLLAGLRAPAGEDED